MIQSMALHISSAAVILRVRVGNEEGARTPGNGKSPVEMSHNANLLV